MYMTSTISQNKIRGLLICNQRFSQTFEDAVSIFMYNIQQTML